MGLSAEVWVMSINEWGDSEKRQMKIQPALPRRAENSSQGSAEWAKEAREQGARPPSAPEKMIKSIMWTCFIIH